jgi:hypothetical protein
MEESPVSLQKKLEYEKKLKHLKDLEASTSDPVKKKRYKKRQEELLKILKKPAPPEPKKKAKPKPKSKAEPKEESK